MLRLCSTWFNPVDFLPRIKYTFGGSNFKNSKRVQCVFLIKDSARHNFTTDAGLKRTKRGRFFVLYAYVCGIITRYTNVGGVGGCLCVCVCFHVSACVFIRHSSEAISRDTSSTRTRRGGSCLKDIYRTFLIYRTCMRRAPAKPVRACTLRKCCLVSQSSTSHFTLDSLHTPHYTLHTALFTLHSSHFTLHTLHTSHCTLRTPHFTLHTAHFTVHTSHCTLRTPNVTLHSPHFTFHTPHFTLHSSCPTLHTAPFISSELFSPYPS